MGGKYFGLESMLESIIERVKTIAQGSYTMGEAIEKDGKTIIPVNTITFGLGGGGGDSWAKGSSELSQTLAEGNMGFGAASGGVRVKTDGFIVMGENGVEILPVPNRSALDGFFDKLPGMLDQMMAKVPEVKGKRMSELESRLEKQEEELLRIEEKSKKGK